MLIELKNVIVTKTRKLSLCCSVAFNRSDSIMPRVLVHPLYATIPAFAFNLLHRSYFQTAIQTEPSKSETLDITISPNPCQADTHHLQSVPQRSATLLSATPPRGVKPHDPRPSHRASQSQSARRGRSPAPSPTVCRQKARLAVRSRPCLYRKLLIK